MISSQMIHVDEHWRCVCLPNDGGRLSSLTYRGVELLTAPPARFQAPPAGFGDFEARPVYGYDDCFPAVAAGRHPAAGQLIPDHGACWGRVAATTRVAAGLESRFDLPEFEAQLVRRLEFAPDRLTWHYRVDNLGAAALACQHVMHALMPPESVAGLRLPACAEAIDSRTGEILSPATSELLASLLLTTPKGKARMLLLRGIQEGRCALTLTNAWTLQIDFPIHLFPTLGIWWDRRGYPEVPGLERDECAFEPIPGPSGSLDEALIAGTALRVPARSHLDWTVTWSFSP